LPETKVDYQDISTMAEVALNSSLSGFVEVPIRFLNPEQNANTWGLADMATGRLTARVPGVRLARRKPGQQAGRKE
jgi:hypothetical protein